jgi:hypothetical protein
MSIRAMSAVWDIDLPDSDKIVLLALADCANDEGHCWPSVASLVRKCSKSERTIQGSIKRLVGEGHLTRREVPGKGCNYTVHPHKKRIGDPRSDNTPAKSAPPQGTAPTPAAAADKPSRTINSEAKASSERVRETYNRVAKVAGFTESQTTDASLRQQIRLRVKEHGEDRLAQAFEMAGRSPWLRGDGRETTWRVDLAWLMTPKNLRKVLDGGYPSDGSEDKSGKWTPERMAEYRSRLEGEARPLGMIAKKILGEAGIQ